MVLRLHNPDMGDIVLDGKSYRDKKSYNAKQFKLDVQPIFQNPYESFSARKPVDSYLFNTALRLGIAKNKAEATNLVDDALKSVGCDSAKSVLELPVEEIAARADLELEQAQKVVAILKAEFEE